MPTNNPSNLGQNRGQPAVEIGNFIPPQVGPGNRTSPTLKRVEHPTSLIPLSYPSYPHYKVLLHKEKHSNQHPSSTAMSYFMSGVEAIGACFNGIH